MADFVPCGEVVRRAYCSSLVASVITYPYAKSPFLSPAYPWTMAFWLKLVKHYRGISQNIFLGNCFVLMKLERIVDLQNPNLIEVDLCVVKMSCLTSVCSATITELDELSSMLPETTAEQENNEDEDTEAEIREYLTLFQLGNILRELSVKGKNNDTLKVYKRI